MEEFRVFKQSRVYWNIQVQGFLPSLQNFWSVPFCTCDHPSLSLSADGLSMLWITVASPSLSLCGHSDLHQTETGLYIPSIPSFQFLEQKSHFVPGLYRLLVQLEVTGVTELHASALYVQVLWKVMNEAVRVGSINQTGILRAVYCNTIEACVYWLKHILNIELDWYHHRIISFWITHSSHENSVCQEFHLISVHQFMKHLFASTRPNVECEYHKTWATWTSLNRYSCCSFN